MIKILLSCLTLFLIFVQVAVDVIQLGNRWEDYDEYIRSFYNVADLLQLSITAVVVIWGLFNGSDPIERPMIRIVAAFSIILLGHKGFVWLTFFDITGAAAYLASRIGVWGSVGRRGLLANLNDL